MYRIACLFFYAAATAASIALFDLAGTSSTALVLTASLGSVIIFVLTALVLRALKTHMQTHGSY